MVQRVLRHRPRTLASNAVPDNSKRSTRPDRPIREVRCREMTRKPARDTPAIQSLDRGLAILEAVAASEAPVPLKQLTSLIAIDRSSVFRLANTLRQRRFLAHPRDSKDYILGPTAWQLSRRYGRTLLGPFFHHYLQDLSATIGET